VKGKIKTAGVAAIRYLEDISGTQRYFSGKKHNKNRNRSGKN